MVAFAADDFHQGKVSMLTDIAPKFADDIPRQRRLPGGLRPVDAGEHIDHRTGPCEKQRYRYGEVGSVQVFTFIHIAYST